MLKKAGEMGLKAAGVKKEDKKEEDASEKFG
jgi:hypothetical protein